MGFLTHFLVLSLFVLPVWGIRYRCHRDICDSSYQFCNDGEERCNICTPEQCQHDVAEHIFNQCEVKCRELETSTATSLKPTSTFAAIVLTQDKPQESHFLTLTAGIIGGISIVIIVVLLSLVLWYACRIDRKVSDLEKGESESYATISTSGEVEKTPLLEQPGIQVVQNDESDSGAHLNKMEEIRTLAEAPAQAATVAVAAQPDLATPPSYTTSDMTNNKPPTLSSVSSVEAVQDSDHYLGKKIPETDFLQQNYEKEKDIGMENTRLKSFQHQSNMISDLEEMGRCAVSLG